MLTTLYRHWIDLRDRLVPPDSEARKLYDRASWAVVQRVFPHLARQYDEQPTLYGMWRQKHAPDLAELRRSSTSGWPSITVLVIGQDRGRVSLSRASLRRQAYKARDVRVAADLPTALSKARGDVVVLVEAGDQLAPDALYRFAEALRTADAAYSDEDVVDLIKRHDQPFFKPDWSPELLTSMNYVGSAIAVKRVLAIGVTSAYDLVLRLDERKANVAHIPRVLYHAAADRLVRNERSTLERSMRRRGANATVTTVGPGRYRTKYAIEGTPRIAIIIPTRDRVDLLRTTIESILARSTWKNYEIIVVDNGSTDPATLEYLAALPAPHRVIRDDRVFNWAALNNVAAATTDAPYLLCLNNDVEVITPDWLEAMLEHAQRPEVGAVGAKLLYPNGTLQHAGVVLGIYGVAAHAFRMRADDGGEYHGLANVVREYAAVTGACLMVRREVFESLSGFDEVLRVAFNDVDFCLRLWKRGLRNVYTPWAKLFHYESASRGAGHPAEDEAFCRARWSQLLTQDPFFSPNLSLQSEQFEPRLHDPL